MSIYYIIHNRHRTQRFGININVKFQQMLTRVKSEKYGGKSYFTGTQENIHQASFQKPPPVALNDSKFRHITAP